ncbi:MAG: hypothetical protein J6X55_01345, partial [Victivallales bacterium]|nr:hypothetical protein [Victivallales bacterium]
MLQALARGFSVWCSERSLGDFKRNPPIYKTILDGIWQFGFQEGDCSEPLSIPTTTVAAVPGCYDAGELFSKRGFGVYRRTVVCGGNVRLSF